MKPRVAIIFSDGLNREQETFYAFKLANGDPEIVHLNDLISGEKTLEDYQIVTFPGGFSYGDDVLSSKILATKVLYRLREQVENFLKSDKLVLGICNGFQMLTRIGALPFQSLGNIDATLIFNDSAKFESRFVKLRVEETNCVFTKGMEGQTFEVPIAHGEGKFIAPEKTLKKIEDQKLVVFRYVNYLGHATEQYPANPNGSVRAIAGITDPSGKILGLMPHPECHVKRTQHPNWNSFPADQIPKPRKIFENAVKYFL